MGLASSGLLRSFACPRAPAPRGSSRLTATLPEEVMAHNGSTYVRDSV